MFRKPIIASALAILAMILIFIFGVTMMKEDYDMSLFLTAACASVTANIVYDIYLKNIVTPLTSEIEGKKLGDVVIAPIEDSL